MQRRNFLRHLLALATVPVVLAACGRAADPVATESDGNNTAPIQSENIQLQKPLSEWQQLLPADVYGVLFEENTERPFSSPLNDEHGAGTFVCAGCAQPLFSSATKYDSGTGWPSFYEARPASVGTKTDRALLLSRTEYHCSRCGGHQGHLFDDGPRPTGLRYCNNGLALNFVAEGQPLPALRS